MKIIFRISVVFMLITIAGCATSAVRVSEADPVPTHRIFNIPKATNIDEAAKIVIVRDSGLNGSGPSAALKINGKLIAYFRTSETLEFSIDEGNYVFGLEPNPSLGAGIKEYSLHAKAGETYYYRISVGMEGFVLQSSYEIRPNNKGSIEP